MSSQCSTSLTTLGIVCLCHFYQSNVWLVWTDCGLFCIFLIITGVWQFRFSLQKHSLSVNLFPFDFFFPILMLISRCPLHIVDPNPCPLVALKIPLSPWGIFLGVNFLEIKDQVGKERSTHQVWGNQEVWEWEIAAELLRPEEWIRIQKFRDRRQQLCPVLIWDWARGRI